MHFEADQIAQWVAAYLWPFLRIGAMMLVAPVFGARNVPVRVRIVLAAFIALIVTPLLPAPPAVDPLSGAGLWIAIQQVLIGIAMGFIVQLVFGAVLIGGQLVAYGMGLGFAQMIDPQHGGQMPVVGQFFIVMTTLVFLALNGHLLLLQVVIDSFRGLPIGTPLGQDGLWQIASFGSRMFAGGLLIALPAVAALLLVNLAFGVMTRSAPQFNIFSVGFPVTIMVGFVVILFILPTLVPQIGAFTVEALGVAHSVTHPPGP